ncbi:hypothetical protein CJ195_22325 [Bacillus sp. UMB0899]|nr:hypothetical protein CJ195_22325 [Bacillus sp. UMB0899]
MEMTSKPFDDVVSEFKRYFNMNYKLVRKAMEEGYILLQQEEKNTPFDDKDIRNIKIYEFFGADPLRTLRYLRKITLEDMCKKEKKEKLFVEYSNIFAKAVYTVDKEPEIPIEALNSLSGEIQNYKEKVQKFIADNNKKTIEMEEERMIKTTKHLGSEKTKQESLKVVEMNQLLYDFLDSVNHVVVTEEDWELAEAIDGFDKYIIVGKQENLYIKNDYRELAISIIEDPVENAVYCVTIGDQEKLDIQEYPSVQLALKKVMQIFNIGLDLPIDGFEKSYTREIKFLDGSTETETFSYDTASTVSQKFSNLLY